MHPVIRCARSHDSVPQTPERTVSVRKRHQKGSLQRKKHGKHWAWFAFWWQNSRRRCKTLGRCSKMTESRAQAELDRILAPINASVRQEEQPGTITFRQFTTGVYLPFCQRHRWKASTAMTTEDRINFHLVSEFGDRELRSLKREELQQFLERKVAAGLSFSVVDHLRWDLRAILRLAVQDGYINRNPADGLCTPRQAKSGEKKILTKGGFVRAIGVLELRERVIVKLATLCGMRPGEIFGLKWEHAHENHVEVQRRVYRGDVDSPKTKRSVRKVGLPPGVAADLAAWREVSVNTSPDAWVFPSERLTTPLSRDNVWNRNIRPRLAEVGLGWANFQVMRRTYSTTSRVAGVDQKVVADQMGHGLGVNLDEYTITTLDQLTAAATKLEAYMVV